MKLLFPIVFFFAQSFFYCQINLTLDVKSFLPDSQFVFIAGNNPQFGNWNPSLIKLNKINDSLWRKSFIFKNNTQLEFKFTKGTWTTEAIYDDNIIPGNFSFTVTEDTTLTFNISRWRNESFPSTQGKITGNVEYIRNLQSEGIKPRDIVIWLPPSYSDSSSKHYPVLYMHDGQNIFDPATSSFGVDWQIDETADSMIKDGSIHEMIIVGIYNTDDRMLEYTMNPLADLYMKFVVNVLKPTIDNKYRTLPDKENTATGGSSAGGLISFMLLWEYNNVFSKAACLSPAFKIDIIDYVSSVLNTNSTKNIKVYIDNGGIGLEEKLQPGIDEMLEALKAKGFTRDIDYIFLRYANDEHTEAAWAKRVWHFLTLFYVK